MTCNDVEAFLLISLSAQKTGADAEAIFASGAFSFARVGFRLDGKRLGDNVWKIIYKKNTKAAFDELAAMN